MTQQGADPAPAQEAQVVIIARDEGDYYCLTDEQGTPRLFPLGDPVIPELLEEARQVYGADARTVSVEEFKALADEAE